MVFRLVYLYLALAYYKGQLGSWNGVSQNILAFLFFLHLKRWLCITPNNRKTTNFITRPRWGSRHSREIVGSPDGNLEPAIIDIGGPKTSPDSELIHNWKLEHIFH